MHLQVMAIAGRALKANITTLAPLILPLSEQVKFLLNAAARKVRFASHLHTITRCMMCLQLPSADKQRN